MKITKGTAVVYFHCDEWKSHASMSLIGVYINIRALIRSIKEELREDAQDYNGKISLLPDIEISEINDRLHYGILEEIILNKKV